MTPHSTRTANEGSAGTEDPFVLWVSEGARSIKRLPEGSLARLYWQHAGNQWHVVAREFDVAGMGTTPEAAYDNVSKLVVAYLHDYFQDGRPFTDAVRKTPWRARIGLRLSQARSQFTDDDSSLPKDRQFLSGMLGSAAATT